MDLGEWLRGLGLDRYEATFKENGVDTEVLPDLTDSDLEKLGVLLGHRKRLLKAIAGLSSAHRAESALGQPATKVEPKPHDNAERRQLTVMFCDLVGSTAMSTRLDPEDMRGVIAAYQKCCTRLITEGGGFVAKYMGDGVLAYFGYPQAHEHDAERAVRAGLAIVDAAPKLETVVGEPLHVRVGIATGIVVVGDLLGSGEAQERGVVGDTPNLAARLQGIAEPDSVVIAEATRKLLGDLFELVDLGPQHLKGVAGPTRAYAALRESSQESRFEALHSGGLTALVGREEELELLMQRWAQAKAGMGHVALISGEPGIGKSRLTAAFLGRLASEPHTRLRYFCSPQHTDSVLYPIIGHMARAAGLAREDDVKSKLDKLDALLAASGASREDAALFADMLSLPNDGRHPVLELTPQQRRHRTMEALIEQIEAIARKTPVLMIFEDAHWSDPSTLETFGRIVDKIDTLPVLLFVTFRSEFAAPWLGRTHVTALTIGRLGPREAMALIDRVATERPLAANIRQDIVERADGVPLFVEEMTKAVLEAESGGAAAGAVASVPLPTLAVPASLHASLMARLDRLGTAKGVAQIGAAIGREISHALLAFVANLPDAELSSALDRLVQSGLMSRQGVPPYATYLFKHALVQDAAYGTLLREARRALHSRIAEVFESQFPEIAENQPELLARHCAEAGLIERAGLLWGRAGLRSLARSALIEGQAQLARALAQIGSLPGTPILRREEIKLQVALMNAQMHAKGYGAPDTKASLERARSLIERAEALGEIPEDPLALFSVLYGFWVANYIVSNGGAQRELATQFLALAERQAAIVPLMIGHRLMGLTCLGAGKFVEGRVHFDRAFSLYDPQEHRPLGTRFGQDIGVAILSWRALTLWALGYPDAGRQDAERALREARQIGQAATLLFALTVTWLTQLFCGNFKEAMAQADEAVALGGEKGAVFWKGVGMMFKASASALAGDAANGAQTIASSIAFFRSTGATVLLPLIQSCLARAHAASGQFDDAWHSIDTATTMLETSGERWCETEVHRTAGEIALMSPASDTTKAQTYFEHALEIARAQHARSWELRAATSLARLWRDQGRRAEANDLLAPIHGWFTEGFETFDMMEAEALLHELAS
jgi:class 3 adenylate cyclase/predicted ATPase